MRFWVTAETDNPIQFPKPHATTGFPAKGYFEIAKDRCRSIQVLCRTRIPLFGKREDSESGVQRCLQNHSHVNFRPSEKLHCGS